MATKEAIFTFDEIEALTNNYFEEMEEDGNAFLTFENGMLTLVVTSFDDISVQVYHVKESPELYEDMEKSYIKILEEQTSGSDFHDMWNAMLGVLEQYKIADDVHNP